MKSDILYDGNTVYPFEKIVKAYRKLQKSGTLDNLTKEMYHFFMYACDDIAHYDIQGYKCYYNNSFRQLENELLANNWTASRFTDIDKVSTSKLKSIIKECGWNVNEANMYWKFSKNIGEKTNYSFDIDILTRNVSDIIRNIDYISNSFNKDSYCEMIYEEIEKNNRPTMSEIVASSNAIKYSLNQLASDVLYKTRIVAEEKESILNKENLKSKENFEYEY